MYFHLAMFLAPSLSLSPTFPLFLSLSHAFLLLRVTFVSLVNLFFVRLFFLHSSSSPFPCQLLKNIECIVLHGMSLTTGRGKILQATATRQKKNFSIQCSSVRCESRKIIELHWNEKLGGSFLNDSWEMAWEKWPEFKRIFTSQFNTDSEYVYTGE